MNQFLCASLLPHPLLLQYTTVYYSSGHVRYRNYLRGERVPHTEGTLTLYNTRTPRVGQISFAQEIHERLQGGMAGELAGKKGEHCSDRRRLRVVREKHLSDGDRVPGQAGYFENIP